MQPKASSVPNLTRNFFQPLASEPLHMLFPLPGMPFSPPLPNVCS